MNLYETTVRSAQRSDSLTQTSFNSVVLFYTLSRCRNHLSRLNINDHAFLFDTLLQRFLLSFKMTGDNNNACMS